MIKRYTNKNLLWIDAENLDKNEIASLMSEFDLEPEVAQELSLPTYKPKISIYKDYIYLVLHFPSFRHNTEEHGQEIDFVIGKNFLITTHYGNIDQLEKVAKVFEVNSILDKYDLNDNAGYLFYFVIKELFKSLNDEIDYINDTLRGIEKKIFAGQEKQMVTALSKVSRNLLEFKNIVWGENETIATLEKSSHAVFDKKLSYNLSSIVSEYYKIEKAIERNIHFLSELRETNNSLLSTKQNEIMKTLTIITFTVMPFTIINSFFQINTNFKPLPNIEYDWFILVGLEVILVFLMYLFARRKKWF
ncbi:MAG: CorA family divalent cation transporter [Minisyncoccia bacterium]